MNELLKDTALFAVMPMLMLSLVLIMVRLIKGPTLLDRVISADLFSTTSIGVVITFSILFGERKFMDVVVLMSVLMFLSTVAFSFYFVKKE